MVRLNSSALSGSSGCCAIADRPFRHAIPPADVGELPGRAGASRPVAEHGRPLVVMRRYAGEAVVNDAQSDVSVARRPLRTISEIRSFFRTNVRPIFFVGPTAFNLLGIDRWVRNFGYLVYYDSWDGAHPLVFTPKNKPFVEFESSEQINNYLLRDPEVQTHVASRVASSGLAPMIAMVFFDEETEQICEELGYNLILPPDSLRRHLDSKIVTTRLGEEAGAPSVPNVIGRADSHTELAKLAAGAGLGSDLVVQTAYGDSGKTTFFIKEERDWRRNAEHMVGEELKIMKRINNRAAAVEPSTPATTPSWGRS